MYPALLLYNHEMVSLLRTTKHMIFKRFFLFFFFFQQFHRFLGCAVCSISLIASISSTIAISYINNSGILFRDLPTNKEDLYIKPWIRISPYIIGILTGYLFHCFKKANRKTLPIPFVVVMWVASAVVGCSVVYGLGHFYDSDEKPTRAEAVTYLSLSRFVAPTVGFVE